MSDLCTFTISVTLPVVFKPCNFPQRFGKKLKIWLNLFCRIRSFLNFPTQCRNLWRVFPSSCSTGILPIRTIRLSSVRIAAKLRKTGVLRLNILLSWSTPTWEGSWFFVAKTVRQLSGKSIFAIMWLWSTARRSADPDREVSFIAAPYFFSKVAAIPLLWPSPDRTLPLWT